MRSIALSLALFSISQAAPAATCLVPSGSYPLVADAVADTTCDPIVVSPGTYSNAQTINRSLTLQGSGAGVVFDGTTVGGRFFTVGSGAVVTFENITVQNTKGAFLVDNATVTLDDVVANGNVTTGNGGVVAAIDASVTLVDSDLDNNQAVEGGVVDALRSTVDVLDTTMQFNDADYGGAIALDASTLTCASSHLDSNAAVVDGGAIHGSASSARLEPCEVTYNTAGGDGGGVYGDLLVFEALQGSSIDFNTAGGDGGGVWVDGGVIDVDTSSVSANSAGTSGLGGGVYGTHLAVLFNNASVRRNSAYDGGGAYVDDADLQAIGSHFNNNDAAHNGAGIDMAAPSTLATIEGCDFFDNEAGWIGGGAHLQAHDVVIRGTHFRGNDAGNNAGGLRTMPSVHHVELTDVHLEANHAPDWGGAAWLQVYAGGTAQIVELVSERNSGGGRLVSIEGVSSVGLVMQDSAFVDNTNTFPSQPAGLFLQSVNGVIENTTFAGNTTTKSSPVALRVDNYSVVDLFNTTFWQNSSAQHAVAATGGATMSFYQSILSNNAVAANCGTFGGSILSGDHNIDDGTSCGFSGANDLSSTGAALGARVALPSPHHPPTAASPAVDSGDNATCPPVDQLGTPRPLDGDGDSIAVCDRGAVEL